MDGKTPISELEYNIDKALDEQFEIINQLQINCNFFKLLSILLMISLCVETFLIFTVI